MRKSWGRSTPTFAFACGTNDKSIWGGLISCRVADVAEILLALTTVTEVTVSINAESVGLASNVHEGKNEGKNYLQAGFEKQRP